MDLQSTRIAIKDQSPILIIPSASADASADESADTSPEMSVNFDFFDHVWTPDTSL